MIISSFIAAFSTSAEMLIALIISTVLCIIAIISSLVGIKSKNISN